MAHANKLCRISCCVFQVSRVVQTPRLHLHVQNVNKHISSKTFHKRAIFYGPSLLSEDKTDKERHASKKLKQSGKLAKVFAEYGTTAVIFHTSISLTSLGICYMAVSSGIDVVALLQRFNLITDVSTEANIAGGATTFVIAYACHKVFMPVRIFCTVTCTPLIVKRLRKLGLLKNPVKIE